MKLQVVQKDNKYYGKECIGEWVSCSVSGAISSNISARKVGSLLQITGAYKSNQNIVITLPFRVQTKNGIVFLLAGSGTNYSKTWVSGPTQLEATCGTDSNAEYMVNIYLNLE